MSSPRSWCSLPGRHAAPALGPGMATIMTFSFVITAANGIDTMSPCTESHTTVVRAHVRAACTTNQRRLQGPRAERATDAAGV